MGVVKVTSLLIKTGSRLGFSFGVGAQTEIDTTKNVCKQKIVLTLYVRIIPGTNKVVNIYMIERVAVCLSSR